MGSGLGTPRLPTLQVYRMAFFALKDGMEKKARKQAFDKMFARFDHNHNGKGFVKDFFEEMTQAGVEVDEEEVKKLTSYAGSDGQVTKDHFKSYCKHSEMFKGLDKNNDGVISDIECTSKAELAFKALDKNSDGFISKREFNEISKTMSKEQIAVVLARFDQDGDGKLSYSEFKKLVKK